MRRHHPLARRPFAGLRILIVAPLAISLLAPRAWANAQPDSLEKISAAVDSLFQRRMARHKINGAAVVVMQNGRVLKSTSYGVANIETNEKVTQQTAFFIASITKAFTTATVFRLVEEGRLKLTDTVGAFVTGLPASWRGATIRQMLSMTSGIPDSSVSAARGIAFPDYKALIAAAGTIPKRPFDEARVYGGTDYVLLGRVVEAITKTSFAEAVKARIFDPLQLRSAAFGDWHDIRAGRAQWYSVLNFDKQDFSAEPFVLRTDYPSYRWPAAGMFISAEELAKFVDALGAGRVLKPETLESYWKPVTIKSGEPQPVALGSWAVFDETVPGHYVAAEGGARSAVTYGRDDHFTIVVLTNLQGGVPNQWIDRIQALYAPAIRK